MEYDPQILMFFWTNNSFLDFKALSQTPVYFFLTIIYNKFEYTLTLTPL